MTTCTICYEEHSSFYSLPCDHKFCGVCLKSHFSLAATEADLSRLVCPDTECRMSLAAPNHMPMILDIAGKPAFEQIQAALNTHLLQSSDFYSCPKCGVKGFSQSDGSSLHGNSVACSKCKFEFCSTCQADMYHYNLPHGDRDCKTVMRQKEAAWLMFCADALGKILEEKGQKDAATKQLHEAFQKTQKEQKRVLAAFERDEKAKATWVHCPHCDALWSGSDACSHVTCGVLSGSEVRGVVGCGREFDLDDAKKYIPAETPSLEELVKPHDSADEISHDASCDKCKATIRGVRLRCLHCPRYNLCIPCLAKRGQGHKGERRWPQKRHVFDIIYKPADSVALQELQNIVDVDADRFDEFDLTMAVSRSLLDLQLHASVENSGSSSSGPAAPPAKRVKT